MLKNKPIIFIISILLIGLGIYTLYQSPTKTTPTENLSTIEELTQDSKVINYVKTHHQLPDYYITKSKAKKLGWEPSKGNLCEVLPNRAIGGDRFGNRERQLPKDKIYFEADVNYNCGRRGADRIIYTKTGEVWLTKNHYKTLKKQ
ncbi:ribonuclease domain-containing protein [Riemerella columbina]|uniref:ribonuclease domain-containing protein n=1 Tax=Riemerella columbina TaxID=103810 RepID=UPI000380875C|nr:ribonuclease domain-containing protein [Riemerella columbina]